jgi:short-subunit dehydrogenase
MQADLLTKYGKWALVTGASNGIGREIAIYLAELGFDLVLVARSEDKLNKLATELTARHDTKTLVLPTDLSDSSGINKVLKQTENLDVGLLVAAAGFGSTGPLLNTNITNELEMLALNCEVPLSMSYHFGQRFVKQKRGGIILFSSLLGFQGAPNSANYAATKGYIQCLGEGLYVELKPHNVDVLISAPGPVATGFAEVADMQMSLSAHPTEVARVTVNALGKTMTIRPGKVAKFLGWSLMTAPRRIRVGIVKIIIDGMIKPKLTST